MLGGRIQCTTVPKDQNQRPDAEYQSAHTDDIHGRADYSKIRSCSARCGRSRYYNGKQKSDHQSHNISPYYHAGLICKGHISDAPPQLPTIYKDRKGANVILPSKLGPLVRWIRSYGQETNYAKDEA